MKTDALKVDNSKATPRPAPKTQEADNEPQLTLAHPITSLFQIVIDNNEDPSGSWCHDKRMDVDAGKTDQGAG